jgi:hypothetical protein
MSSLSGKRSLLVVASVLLMLATTVGMFISVPTLLGWAYWRYETGNAVSSVAVSSNADYVIAGTENGGLYLLDRQRSLVWQKSFSKKVVDVSISADASRILIVTDEHLTGVPDAFLFDNDGNTVWAKDLVDYALPCAVSISQDGAYFVVADDDHQVRFFNGSGSQLWINELGDRVSSVSVSSSGNLVVAGSLDNNVYCFNKSGVELWRYDTGHDVDGVSISPEGAYVASVGTDIFLLDGGGNHLWNKTYYYGSKISVSANGNYMVTGKDYSRETTMLNKTGGQVWKWNFEGYVNDVAVSSDGVFVAVATEAGFVYLIENSAPASITCEVPEPAIEFGGEVNVFGSISVPVEGAVVTLTFTRPDHSIVTVNVTTTAGGVYNYAYSPDVKGSWSVNAFWAGDEQYMGAQSSTTPFDVGVSSITCQVQTWQVYLGEAVTVFGRIDPTRNVVTVTLTYTDPDDVEFNRTVTTQGDGNYTDTFTPSLEGMWTAQASWLGDANTLGSASSEVRFLVSTVQKAFIKIGWHLPFLTIFEPPKDYYYSRSFESIVWDTNVTSPPGINFTITKGEFEYTETIPGLGGTITSFEIWYEIGVLEGTPEGTYEAVVLCDISSQSKLWPYSTTFLFRYELRCSIDALVKYGTSIELFPPLQVRLGEAANVWGKVVATGGLSVASANVTLSYTRPDATAFNRTAVTAYNGTFQDGYVPDMLGTWCVKVTWTGDVAYNGSESVQVEFDVLKEIAHQATWDTGVHSVCTLSNSTVSDFYFNGSAKQLGFSVSGLPGTDGFCNVTIPRNLLRGYPWTILLDNTDWTSSCTMAENSTHSFICIPYAHSIHNIQLVGTWIVPEFPYLLLAPLILATLVAVLISRTKRIS